MLFVVTTGRRTSAPRSNDGPSNGASSSNTSNPASPSRTPMSSGSTARYGTSGCPSTTGQTWKRFKCMPHNGCGSTTMNARIWPWAASPRSSVWPWLRNQSTSHSSGKRGDYRFSVSMIWLSLNLDFFIKNPFHWKKSTSRSYALKGRSPGFRGDFTSTFVK